MFKKILLVLLALIAAFVVYIAVQPDEYRVERTVTMAAPAEKVFKNVNDLQKWEAWSPWAKIDPDAKLTFEGPDAGKGSAMTWDGDNDVGAGTVTIVESDPGPSRQLESDLHAAFRGRHPF